jgi:hypothetical protein
MSGRREPSREWYLSDQFAAEPGDTASVTLERSLLGWPASFTWAMTYLSGPPTTWLRHLYYRLSWKKASGARLNMVWRCEQGYEAINGWHNFGFAELIQVEIQPAPPSQPPSIGRLIRGYRIAGRRKQRKVRTRLKLMDMSPVHSAETSAGIQIGKGRVPPGEAIRGPARPSIVVRPE